jgi:hypothetical protein
MTAREVGERGTQPGPAAGSDARLKGGLGEVDSFGAPVFWAGDADEAAVALEAVDDGQEGLFSWAASSVSRASPPATKIKSDASKGWAVMSWVAYSAASSCPSW